MHLILLRHGKAESDAPSGRDADRLLRPRGEQQARFVGEALAGRSPRPGPILSSGIVRAVQTARIVQRALGCVLRVEGALETDATPGGVVELIERERGGTGEGGLVLVGHNPTFEDLAGILTSGPGAPPITLRTGEAFVLEAPGGPGGIVGACTLVESIRLDEE
jgi:phosphohistidine phosphatase SixA